MMYKASLALAAVLVSIAITVNILPIMVQSMRVLSAAVR